MWVRKLLLDQDDLCDVVDIVKWKNADKKAVDCHKLTRRVSSRREGETDPWPALRSQRGSATDHSMPSFLILYRNDRKVIPNSAAAFVLL
jgi:hypothetical protein